MEETQGIGLTFLRYGNQDLRADLNQLEDWGSVRQRLEPRRIRRLEDRGLNRYLIRLTEGMHEILEELEGRVEKAQARKRASARDLLRDVEGALQKALEVLSAEEVPGAENLCRARRRARHAEGTGAPLAPPCAIGGTPCGPPFPQPVLPWSTTSSA